MSPATRNLSAYRGSTHRHQITVTDGVDPVDWSDRTWTAVLRTVDHRTVCDFTVDATDASAGVLVVSLAATDTDRVGRFRWALIGTDGADVDVPLAGEFVLHTATATPGDTTEATVVTVAEDATTVEVGTWVTSGGGGGVTSVNGDTGVVVLTAADVGALGATAGAGGVLSGNFPNPGFAVDMVEQTELTSALAGYQPLDSDLTAIAALTTTTFGRALLALADAAAGRTALGLGSLATQSGTFSGTSSGTNTGDQDLSSYATTAAVAAGYQPLDSDLTAIAALSTTSYGRSLLTSADIAALRDALDADDKRPLAFPFSTYQATTGTVTPSGSVLYTLLAASSSAEWTVCTFPAGTWRFALNLVTTNAAVGSTIQLSVGGSNLGSAVSTYDASATPRLTVVDTDKTFTTRTLAAVKWTTNASGAARCVAWTAWRTA